MSDERGPFEMLEGEEGKVQFCFSHSDKQFTTGVMVLRPNAELPKHNRPLAIENLLQVSGVCQVTLYSEKGEIEASYELRPGTSLRMKKGQWHVHANPFEEESVTLFKAEGDITQVVQTLRHKFEAVTIEPAPER